MAGVRSREPRKLREGLRPVPRGTPPGDVGGRSSRPLARAGARRCPCGVTAVDASSSVAAGEAYLRPNVVPASPEAGTVPQFGALRNLSTLSFVTTSRPTTVIAGTFSPFFNWSRMSIAFSPISLGRCPTRTWA